MITPVCQRWCERRDSYRPKGEVMDPREYEVSALPTAEAKAFVISHHYSGTFPAARRSFALHRRGQLVGVAVFRDDLAQIMRLLPDGSVLSARAIAKIKAMDQGWLYASKILIEHGAEPLRIGADLFGAADDPKVWTERWVLALTRPVRHPGNWRYDFPLQRKVKSKLPALPYPKFGARP